jgi:hypothetical protein
MVGGKTGEVRCFYCGADVTDEDMLDLLAHSGLGDSCVVRCAECRKRNRPVVLSKTGVKLSRES